MNRDPLEALEQHYADISKSQAPNQLTELLRLERERRLSNRAMVLAAALVFCVSSLVLATAASYTTQIEAGQSLPFFRKHFTDLGEEGGNGI
jgi:hypothetical protein